jgi:galactokinase
LNTRFLKDETTGLAYVYCNFRRQDEPKADNLLANLSKQLAERHPSLAESIRALYDQHKDKRRTQQLSNEIQRAFQSAIAIYARVLLLLTPLMNAKHLMAAEGGSYPSFSTSTPDME